MTDWTLSAELWPTVVTMLELAAAPWPENLARADLAFLRAEVAAGARSRVPGRAVLAQRWGWPAYDVRALLERLNRATARHSPEPRQPGFSPDPAGRGSSLISGSHFAQSSPSGHPTVASLSDLLTDQDPGDQPSPGVRQNLAQPRTGEGQQSSDFRPSLAQVSPAQDPTVPPHTPPPDLPLISGSQIDQEEGCGEEGTAQPGPAAQPALFAPPPSPLERARELPEARAFLQVWGRWRHDPRAPKRWAGGPSEALAWFLEQLTLPPDTEIGGAIAKLDVPAAIQAWDAWLADRVEEAGKPGTAARSKFPHNWKSALRNWLINQARFGRNLRPAARPGAARRGAWAGRATQFLPAGPAPASADPGGPDLSTPPGDFDALDRF